MNNALLISVVAMVRRLRIVRVSSKRCWSREWIYWICQWGAIASQPWLDFSINGNVTKWMKLEDSL
jgi:hypothetical protein